MTQYNSPKNKRKDNNPYLAFLHSLEEYQHKTEKLDYDNCIHLKQLIQHYYDTHYQYYYGSTIPYYSNFPSLPSSNDIEDETIKTSLQGGWLAFVQHYFVIILLKTLTLFYLEGQTIRML